MDLSDLREELQGRGFDFLSPARCDAYLNAAYKEINDTADWPWLETTTSGTAPLTITDLRSILYVHDTTNDKPLKPADVRRLGELYATDLTTTGTCELYWLDGTTTLKVQPPDTTSSLSVRYLKNAATLALDADVPIVPTGHHLLIATIAQRKAAALDEAEQVDVALLDKEIQAELSRMVSTYMNRTLDGPDYISTGFGNSIDW